MTSILIPILLLSIWYSILFLGYDYGLSVILFIVPFILFTFITFKKNKIINNKKALLLIIPIILLSITYFLFNNTLFNLLNRLVIPFLFVMMFICLLNKQVDLEKAIKKGISLIIKPFTHIRDVINLLKERINNLLKDKVNEKTKEKIVKFAKTIIITIPLLLIIIYLLSSADLVFARTFKNITDFFNRLFSNIKIIQLIRRIFGIGITFIYLSSVFHYVLFDHSEKQIIDRVKVKFKNIFTIKSILTSLNIIYLVFCIIQIKSLFLQSISANINYAEYARQGFFQLMIVSIINLVIILISKQYRDKKDSKYINIMDIVMIVFTFIILISSFMRMNLYEAQYGYTILRLLVYISLITEAILLFPTILYIIDKKVNLFKTYFIIIVVIYTITNFINLDYMIAKRNVNRYFEINDIDIVYLENFTGTDAIYELEKLYKKTTDEEIKKELFTYLSMTYKSLKEENEDFRSFNISKYKAKRNLQELLAKDRL